MNSMGLPGNRDGIEKRLQQEVESAFADYTVASSQFRQLISDGAGAPPDAVGALSAAQVSERNTVALKRYAHALERLNAFKLHGTLPEDY
jgi:hypothetical protein